MVCLWEPVSEERRCPSLALKAQQCSMSNIRLSLWIIKRGRVSAPRLGDQVKQSHYKPVQPELNHVLWVQMKWPAQCVLNVPLFPWAAITPTSPRVNSEMEGPIGYLAAMMWHSGRLFSRGAGRNLHFSNFQEQQAIKKEIVRRKKVMKETRRAWNDRCYWCV